MVASTLEHDAARAVEFEAELLGALLIDAKTAWPLVKGIVGAQDFHCREYGLIFTAIVQVIGQHGVADAFLVTDQLGDLLPAAGGASIIQALADASVGASNAGTYAKEVRKFADRDQGADVATEIAADFRRGTNGAQMREKYERLGVFVKGPTPITAALRSVDMSDLATVSPIPPRFVVDLLLPRDEVTLLAGHGDAGKTLLALVMACHVVCGRDFADLPVIGGRVLFVSLEDSGDLIKLRCRRIATEFGLDLDTILNRLTVLDALDVDETSLAFEISQAGIRSLQFTPAFDLIAARAPGHDLIVIDNASDAYDASEIERRMVRKFVRTIKRKIAIPNHASVLLLAHIDKHAARHGAAGETYSGSTAWHNSARSRLALVERDSFLELHHEKHNLSKGLEHPIVLQRSEVGIPVPLSPGETSARSRSDLDAVHAAIQGAQSSSVTIPTNTNGYNTVTQVLATRPEIPEALAKEPKRIRVALAALEREGLIWRDTYRDEERRKTKECYKCAR